jgi:hypothetical protein
VAWDRGSCSREEQVPLRTGEAVKAGAETMVARPSGPSGSGRLVDIDSDADPFHDPAIGGVHRQGREPMQPEGAVVAADALRQLVRLAAEGCLLPSTVFMLGIAGVNERDPVPAVVRLWGVTRVGAASPVEIHGVSIRLGDPDDVRQGLRATVARPSESRS